MHVVSMKRFMHRILCELQIHFVSGFVMYQFISSIFTWLELGMEELECN